MSVLQIDGSVSGAVIKDRIDQLVFTKSSWGGRWIYQPHIWPVEITEAIAPNLSNGILKYDSGDIIREDVNFYQTYTPINIDSHFVKVEIASPQGGGRLFVGIVQADRTTIGGVNSTTFTGSAKQEYVVLGIEHLLSRHKVFGTYVEADARFIGRTVVFNERFRRGISFSGNRSSGKVGDSYVFDRAGTSVWTHLTMLEYILDRFQFAEPIFRLSGQSSVLSQLITRFDPHGLSIKECLDRLVDRRRGLAWRVSPNSDGGIVDIQIFTTVPDPVTLGEFTLPANPSQANLDFDQLIDLSPRVTTSDINLYDKIVVRGANLKTCMSFALSNATLEEGWTSGEKTAYDDAPDDERATDTHDRVYTTFRVPRDWGFTYTTLDDATPDTIANPLVNMDAEVDMTLQDTFWNRGKAFLRYIPIETPTSDPDAEPEFLEPFAVIRNPGDTDPDNYSYADQLSNDLPRLNNLQLRMMDREFGIQIRGALNHYAAKDHFDPATAATTAVQPQVDYDDLILTAFFENDSPLFASALIASHVANPAGRTLVIDDPDSEYWMIAPGTVIDVVVGALVFNNGGAAEVVRDDGARLRAILLSAVAWYGSQRATLHYDFKGIGLFTPPGTLIRGLVHSGLGFSVVGTVVTEKVYTFRDADGLPRTIVRTGFEELDAEVFT